MEKKISLTNTKSEILNAYNELLKRIQDSKQESPKAEQEKKVKEATVEGAAKLTDEEIKSRKFSG
jgi:hypothetical protein